MVGHCIKQLITDCPTTSTLTREQAEQCFEDKQDRESFVQLLGALLKSDSIDFYYAQRKDADLTDWG